jgi:hypothetical protein
VALGRCLRRRWNGISYSTVCAELLLAQAVNDDALHAAVGKHRINEQWMWTKPPVGWKWGSDAPPEAYQYPPKGRW